MSLSSQPQQWPHAIAEFKAAKLQTSNLNHQTFKVEINKQYQASIKVFDHSNNCIGYWHD